MAKDPVCGKTVEDDDAVHSVEYRGRTYHFCSSECEEVFETDPAPYVEAVG